MRPASPGRYPAKTAAIADRDLLLPRLSNLVLGTSVGESGERHNADGERLHIRSTVVRSIVEHLWSRPKGPLTAAPRLRHAQKTVAERPRTARLGVATAGRRLAISGDGGWTRAARRTKSLQIVAARVGRPAVSGIGGHHAARSRGILSRSAGSTLIGSISLGTHHDDATDARSLAARERPPLAALVDHAGAIVVRRRACHRERGKRERDGAQGNRRRAEGGAE